MEESIGLLNCIKSKFNCKEVDIRGYSPLTLAYIGDAIYDLIIRTIIVERANRATNELHKRTTRYVKAATQAMMIEAIVPILTEEELAIYKRGRNAKSYTSAKNATIAEYRKATGFEALAGYLYLTNQVDRLLILIEKALQKFELSI